MPANVYEFLATRNATLVRFLDENPSLSGAIMKMVKMIVRICEEKHLSAPDLTYEVYSPRAAEDVIIIRLKKKGE